MSGLAEFCCRSGQTATNGNHVGKIVYKQRKTVMYCKPTSCAIFFQTRIYTAIMTKFLSRVKKTFLIVFILAGFNWPALTMAKPYSIPFTPGERLVFQLSWTFIPAGEAVMEIQPHASINGDQAWHFRMIAESNSFVDAFYKVRERIDAFSNTGMTHSVLYKKKQREGSTHRDVVVKFDHKNKTVQYTNFKKKNKPLTILPGAFDPLSAFYYIRGLNMSNDSSIERPVTDGKKCVIGMVRVVKRETIKVPSGTYDTWLIEPDLKHVGGVFKKSKNAKLQLWVTADSRRIPVKIKSRVVVGSFVGELVSVTSKKNSIEKSVATHISNK